MEILFEILLQIIVELLAEGLSRKEIHKSTALLSPAISMLGYLFLGMMAGGISLLFFPESFLQNATLRAINLIIAPVVIGGIMCFIGRLRIKKGQKTVRLDTFSYAFLFAFGMAAARFAGTE